MIRTKTIFCSIIVLLFLLSENALSQAGKGAPLLTKYAKKPRAGKIIARSFASARMTGGVLTTGYTDVFLGVDQGFVDPSKISFGNYHSDENELCIHVDVDASGTCYRWEITAERLSRLASLIDNNGIGLFSAYADNFEEEELTEEELEGYVDCELVFSNFGKYWCAYEIAGSSLEQSFHDLDLRSREFWSPEPRKSELMAEFNSNLPSGDILDEETEAYEVSDLSSNFKVYLVDNKVQFEGTAHIFHRSVLEVNHEYAKKFPSKVTKEPLITIGEVESFSEDDLELIKELNGWSKEDLIAKTNEIKWFFNEVKITNIQRLNISALSIDEYKKQSADDWFSSCDDSSVEELQSEREISYKEAAEYHNKLADGCKDEFENYEKLRSSVADGVQAIHELAFLRLIKKENPDVWQGLWDKTQ